ncbi:Hypothetical predicted protein [Prunus dulcis]|uniref:Uncharacterized protein n=1 Tax=Prunus dulcis TaxID=3755 RepID=A0A5E4F8N7_PRUDU|nr:hypothetical protein L3X38_028069 [Prunus dulcis]VVA23449.1 Hypothetical predicted protein [Prunus dulcis]
MQKNSQLLHGIRAKILCLCPHLPLLPLSLLPRNSAAADSDQAYFSISYSDLAYLQDPAMVVLWFSADYSKIIKYSHVATVVCCLIKLIFLLSTQIELIYKA